MKMRLRSDQQQSIFKKVLSNHTSSTQTYILAVWQREESSHRNWEELGLLTSGSEARPISSLDNLHSFSQLTKHTCDQSHTHTGNKTEENKEHTGEILPRSIGLKQNCYHIFFLLNYTSFLLRSDNYLLSSTNTFVLNTLRERKRERERETHQSDGGFGGKQALFLPGKVGGWFEICALKRSCATAAGEGLFLQCVRYDWTLANAATLHFSCSAYTEQCHLSLF